MLSERDRTVLDFEGSWFLYPEPKDRAISDYLNMSATRYYQILRRLATSDEALEHAPLTVRRLRKLKRSRFERLAPRIGDTGSSG